MITGSRALKELGEMQTAKPGEIAPPVILQMMGFFKVNQPSRGEEKMENCGLWMNFALPLKLSFTGIKFSSSGIFLSRAVLWFLATWAHKDNLPNSPSLQYFKCFRWVRSQKLGDLPAEHRYTYRQNLTFAGLNHTFSSSLNPQNLASQPWAPSTGFPSADFVHLNLQTLCLSHSTSQELRVENKRQLETSP